MPGLPFVQIFGFLPALTWYGVGEEVLGSTLGG